VTPEVNELHVNLVDARSQ